MHVRRFGPCAYTKRPPYGRIDTRAHIRRPAQNVPTIYHFKFNSFSAFRRQCGQRNMRSIEWLERANAEQTRLTCSQPVGRVTEQQPQRLLTTSRNTGRSGFENNMLISSRNGSERGEINCSANIGAHMIN